MAHAHIDANDEVIWVAQEQNIGEQTPIAEKALDKTALKPIDFASYFYQR